MSSRTSPTVVYCPHCGEPVEWTDQSPWRPFCSERCRLIDLGEWLNEGGRSIPGESEPGSDNPGSADD